MTAAAAPLVTRLDELSLLRAFAEAHRKYELKLRALRGEALAQGAIVQDLDVLTLKAAADDLFHLWELQYRQQPADADRARAAGAV